MRRLAALAVLVAAAACAGDDAIPTYRVASRPFEQRVTAEGVLAAEKATPVTVPPDVENVVRLAWLAPDGTPVEAGQVVARFDATEMEESLEAGRSEVASVALKVDKADVQGDDKLVEHDTEYKVAGLDLEVARRFQKTDEDVFSRHEIIESRIDEQLARQRQGHASESGELQQALTETELALLGIERRKAKLKIDQAEGGLAALEVRAPHAGILALTRDWRGESVQVGAQMWRGQSIAEIPDLETLEAEVFVLEADAGGLAAGKPATVVVEAHPDVAYKAQIRRVDNVAKPRFRGSPVQYFGVNLALEERDLTVMKPGQRVRATLLLQQQPEALVVPRQAVRQAAGEARVYVADGAGFLPRRVELGASSMGLVVVTEGLASGEVVALDPAAAAARASAAPESSGTPGS